jgi:uncharacterized membrane protein YadS
VATASKLARALWIVPVTFGVAAARARATGAGRSRPPLPWFVAGFVAAAAAVALAPGLREAGRLVAACAHRALALALFLSGLGLSRGALRALGPRPLAHAFVLWSLLTATTLAAVTVGRAS